MKRTSILGLFGALLAVATGARVGWSPIGVREGPLPSVQQPEPSRTRIETVEIDPRAPERPFPHFWERMFGSGRAILSLRESYRRDLRAVKEATDFDYVRFHAVFHDEVGVYDEGVDGHPIYNFSYVD